MKDCKNSKKNSTMYLVTVVLVGVLLIEGSPLCFGQDVVWTVTENPSGSHEEAHAICSDDTYIYVAGQDLIPGNEEWRIQKRNKSDGSEEWTVTENPSGFHESLATITCDGSYIYVGGYDYVPGYSRWKIQKRNTSDGSVVWDVTEDPGPSVAADITYDDTYIYIVGYVREGSGNQWRLQKRYKSDGSVVWTKTQNWSGNADEAFNITSDDSYIYLAGWDYSLGNYQWRIQKRSKSDGSIIWDVSDNPSGSADMASEICSDDTYIYVAGFDSSAGSGNHQWRIQKRNKTDGSVVWTETENPSSSDDWPSAITCSGSHIYVTGYDRSLGDKQWRIQKRNKTDGSVVWTETENPSNSIDGVQDITVDDTYIYVAGYDSSQGNRQWRIQKREAEPSGPVAYWSFDDEADPGHDDSGNGHDGTVYGATSVDGVCGKALRFDEFEERVKIPHSVLNGAKDFTFAAWVNMDSTMEGSFNSTVDRTILSGAESPSLHNEVRFAIYNHADEPYIVRTSLQHGGTADTYAENVVVDQWMHIAWVRHSATGAVKFYVSGVEQFDISNPAWIGAISIAQDGLWLGNDQDNGIGTGWQTQDQFLGKLDEVRIYDRALSESEIAEIAEECPGPDCMSLLQQVAIIDVSPGWEHCKDLAVDGQSLFVGVYSGTGGADDPAGLLAYDISNPANTTDDPIGSVLLHDGGLQDIKLVGGIAYLAHEWLSLVDVSDPYALSVLCNHNEASPPTPFQSAFLGVEVSGNYAYVTDHWRGLRVVDISGPCPVSEICSPLDLPYFEHGIKVFGTTLYAPTAHRPHGAYLNAIDISTASSPTVISRLALPLAPDQLVVSDEGEYAYLAAYEGGLQVVRISDPANMELVGSYPLSASRDIAREGNIVFVADSDRVAVVDVTNPSKPVLLNSYTLPGEPTRIAADNGFVYVSCQIQGKVVIFKNACNIEPVADANDNIQISSSEQGYTVIQGTATDPDGDFLEYRWFEGAQLLCDWTASGSSGEAYLDLGTLPYFTIGNHTLTLEVTDSQLTASDEMVLTIDNSPPEAQPAPSYQVVEFAIDSIVVVADVADFDGDTLSYEWLKDGVTLDSGTVPTLQGGTAVPIPELMIPPADPLFPVGLHIIELRVSDGINEPVSATVSVEVSDTTSPSLSPIPSTTILWPPNHELVEVTIQANAFDNGGGAITLDISIESSEPADGDGDGSTEPDWYLDSVDDETGLVELRLRSERSGKGQGRIYTITITATDGSGNQSAAEVEISAPHDKRKK